MEIHGNDINNDAKESISRKDQLDKFHALMYSSILFGLMFEIAKFVEQKEVSSTITIYKVLLQSKFPAVQKAIVFI